MADDFEALGPEKFQLFCQALIQHVYPDVQCMPIGQPDGGRDALIGGTTTSSPRIVFQVKFARNPAAIPDPVAWLSHAIDSERPKLARLAARGTKQYYLLTNLPGSAHLDVGQIDRLADVISDLPVHAQCWWRTDLSVRLQNAPHLRWQYHELLTAGSLLEYFLATSSERERERLRTIMTLYLERSYVIEREVRFRQVELQNSLLDLFIDVPLAWNASGMRDEDDEEMLARLRLLQTNVNAAIYGHGTLAALRREHRVPYFAETATTLLHPSTSQLFPQLVIEGAPGQGKSTLVQYLCQVHRIRLLSKQTDLPLLSTFHRESPVRLPFRVDLKDYAVWIRGEHNPFIPGASRPNEWDPSLESFLVAQIRHRIGGRTFTVDDLALAHSESPVLLCLDGLDEVAEISLRDRIVEQSSEAIERIRNSCPSLQVVITSRPAAFAKSPGFHRTRFPTFNLLAITPELAVAYGERWGEVKKLPEEERAHVRHVLATKLQQPHVRDLSRNAMQLAILLTLINTLGESLPDARTAVYDEYVKLFISREAEKTPAVQKYRSIVLDVHRYLAWKLHSETETSNPQGAISAVELRAVLFSYLEREGQSTTIVDELFRGMLERVVFLVPRIVGMYEFEVQPLREYFCARHLYDTAPMSSVGRIEPDAKPDRFDAIARNPYWLNVTRFYAGCYTKGELSGLADALVELYRSADWSGTPHPRHLCLMLLSDYVFEQNPKATEKVVGELLRELSVRHTLTVESGGGPSGSEVSVLPAAAGRKDVIAKSWEVLSSGPTMDRALGVCKVLSSHADPAELLPKWVELASEAEPKERATWFRYGVVLGVLREVAPSSLGVLIDAENYSAAVAEMLESGTLSYIESSQEQSWKAVEAILTSNKYAAVLPQSCESPILQLTAYLTLLEMTGPGSLDPGRPFAQAWESANYYPRAAEIRGTCLDSTVLQSVQEANDVFREQSALPAEVWRSSLAPWVECTAALERLAHHRTWAAYKLAALASDIRSRKEHGVASSGFSDDRIAIPEVARFARLQSGSPAWWEIALSDATLDDLQTSLAVSLFGSWATERTVRAVGAMFARMLDTLSRTAFLRVYLLTRRIVARRERPALTGTVDEEWVSPRCAVILSLRTTNASQDAAYLRRMSTADEASGVIRIRALQRLSLLDRSSGSADVLGALREEYARGVFAHVRGVGAAIRSVRAAQAVMSHADEFPLSAVRTAERTLFRRASLRAEPIAELARRRGWFT